MQEVGSHPRAPAARRLGYVRCLDGIRGLAVLAVLLFHGGASWARGGFLGVDVFFVLSGFLITTLLLEELGEHETIRLRAFWTRRARRLLPALVVVALVVALAPGLVAVDRSVAEVRKDSAAALAYLANWRFVAAGSSYFERTGAPSPLTHTWSLAVEEQFYLVWPLLVLLVARRGRAWVALAASTGAIASAVAMAALYRPGGDPSRVYYGTDTHGQVVLIGALLAVALSGRRLFPGAAVAWTRRGRRGLAVCSGGALAALGLALVRASGHSLWLYRGGLAAVAVATAVVIAAGVLDPEGLASRVLSLRPLRALGELSYGVYLWHWPLFLFLTRSRTGLAGPTLLGVRVAASVAVAALSARWIERPVRVGRLLPGLRAGVVLPAVASAAAVVLLATTVVSAPPRLVSAAAAGEGSTTVPLLAPTTVAAAPAAVRPPKAPGAPARLLLVGDSVALTLGAALGPHLRQAGFDLRNEATLGCGIVRGGPYRYFGGQNNNLPECERWPARWSAAVARHDPDIVMVVVGRWEVMDRVHNGRWVHVGDRDFDGYLASELEDALSVLTGRGAVVAFCTAPYYLRGERPDGGRWPEDDPARVNRFNEVLRSVVARHPGRATLVELGAHTSAGGRYTRSLDGVELRYDGVHFTPRSGRWLAPWLLPQLEALAASASGPGATTPSATSESGGGGVRASG